MKTFQAALLPAALCLLLSACAGPVTMAPRLSSPEVAAEAERQQALVLERALKDQRRLDDIAFALQYANAEFCADKTARASGLGLWNASTLHRDQRAAALALYGLDDRLRIRHVARKSPAAKAGLRDGDIILALNGETFKSGSAGLKAFARLRAQDAVGAADITVQRGDKTIKARLPAIAACDFPATVDHGESDINAFADGTRIVVTRGMMRFAETDNELALVVGHELAHSALLHVNKLQQNAMAGMIGGMLLDVAFAAGGLSTGGQFTQMGGDIGMQSHSVGFEQEADYVGMYFMERAGFNSAQAPDFWRRMGAEGESAIRLRTSHPTSPERFVAMESTHREIAAKKARRQALKPNFIEKD